VVVDHDVQVLPAAAAAAVADLGSEGAFARLPEAAEFLDVEME